MSIELDDETVFDVSKMLYNEFREEENEKRLDEDHLEEFKRQFIKPLYPHLDYEEEGEKKIRKYTCSEFCCELTPGVFCCCSSSPPDQVYKDFGLGTCLYFKFIRHLMIFLIFVGVLSAISTLLYFMVAINTDFDILANYEHFIFSGTVGILSARNNQCQYSQLDQNKAQFNISCSHGVIELVGAVSSPETKNSLGNCRSEIDKIRRNDQENGAYEITYIQTQNCNDDRSSCRVVLNNISNTDKSYISMVYTCQGSRYPVGAINFTDESVIYVTVAIDLFIIVMFLIFLFSENRAEKKQVLYFKKNQLSLHDFALEVHGFNSHDFDDQFDYFAEGMNEKTQIMESFTKNVVMVKAHQSQQTRQAIENRRKCYQKLFDLIEKYFFYEGKDLNNYESVEEFHQGCFDEEPEIYAEYKRKLTKHVNNYAESKALKLKERKRIPVSCYIVMSNPKYKRAILESSESKCFKKYITVNETKHRVGQPPIADMILWENKYKWTCFRVILVWIITLGICFCSYLLVGVAQFEQTKLKSDNSFDVDCDVVFDEDTLVNYDRSLINSEGYLHCYCFHNYFQRFQISQQVSSNCEGWRQQYALFLAIPILISLGIVVYNVLVSRIFKFLTKFEGHNELTTELYSYIIKRTFVLVMNMGLLIILLKFDYNGSFNNDNLSFLFQGTYNDVTTDWYLEIGVLIILTLAINIFIPIFQMLFLGFLKWMRRIWDRRCCSRKTSQKTKKGYIQLYSGDVYPLEERYADFLSIIIITLAFSGVMPGLYIIAFLSITFLFTCDKFLLFRVYQKPVNYAANLQSKIFKTVFVTLIIHCLVTPFLLSEPNLVVDTEEYIKFIDTDFDRFDNIFKTAYLIPYVVLFIILFLWAFFSATIIQLIVFCYSQCKEQMLTVVHEDKLNSNFFHVLDEYQTQRLKLSIERDTTKKFHRSPAKAAFLKPNDSETLFMKGTQKIHFRENISRKTLEILEQRQSRGKRLNKSKVKLIGKAGYEQVYDDDVFARERKIRHLDNRFKKILKKVFNKESQQSVGEMTVTL